MNINILTPRTALYLPASNPRAIARAPTLDVDMIILDLEDAVRGEDKDAARAAAVDVVEHGMPGKSVGIRINGTGTASHIADIIAVKGSKADFIVMPKVASAAQCTAIATTVNKPMLAMIETPRALYDCKIIASAPGVIGLIAGTNDLSYELRIPIANDRMGLTLALQSIILAARTAAIWALDGVFNDLANPDGFRAQCQQGRQYGFDGKTLIHPNQVEIANVEFSPSKTELEDARRLVEAASGGAQRFRNRMIETMHVDTAKRLIDRADK